MKYWLLISICPFLTHKSFKNYLFEYQFFVISGNFSHWLRLAIFIGRGHDLQPEHGMPVGGPLRSYDHERFSRLPAAGTERMRKESLPVQCYPWNCLLNAADSIFISVSLCWLVLEKKLLDTQCLGIIKGRRSERWGGRSQRLQRFFSSHYKW